MQFHFHANQTHFHKNGFALRLALKQTHKGTRKWPIMHSRVQQPRRLTKESVYLRKELNSLRIGLVQQHGRHCEHQCVYALFST